MDNTDRGFSHPKFGKEVRIERNGKEVSITFVAGTISQARDLVESALTQLKAGYFQISLMGNPSSIEEDPL